MQIYDHIKIYERKVQRENGFGKQNKVPLESKE